MRAERVPGPRVYVCDTCGNTNQWANRPRKQPTARPTVALTPVFVEADKIARATPGRGPFQVPPGLYGSVSTLLQTAGMARTDPDETREHVIFRGRVMLRGE